MTIKTVITHAEPDWGSGEALTAALHVSHMFAAHVIGVGAEAFEVVTGDFLDGAMVQMIRDQVDVDLASASARFMAATLNHPHGATFVSGMERPAALTCRHARGADLVVARRVPSDAGATNLCRPADLIIESGTPVLLAPHAAAPLKADAVVVAWKDHREARRALADALPFLRRADRVALVQVCPQDDRAAEGLNLREVVDRLRRLGVKAEGVVKAGAAGSPLRQIEEVANEIGGDLIVAGAFTHTRVREWAFGGVTQDLLMDCDRHVLFSH